MTRNAKVFSVPGHPTSSQRRTIRREVLHSLRFNSGDLFLDFSSRKVLDVDDLELLLACAQAFSRKETTFVVIAGSASNRILMDISRTSSVLTVVECSMETAREDRSLRELDGILSSANFTSGGHR